MTFEEQIVITLLDKGMLAAFAGLGGFVLSWFLQRKKARDELLHELTPSRVTAYMKLWAITGDFVTSRREEIPRAKRVEMDGKLIEWYYTQGGALFLSWKAAKCFLESADVLRNDNSPSDDVRKAFSTLRTILKKDCGIYSDFDVQRHIAQPRQPLSPARPSLKPTQ